MRIHKKKERIFLINPPVYEASLNFFTHHPTGLLKLGAFYKNKGAEVVLIDFFDTYEDAYRVEWDQSKLRVVDEKECGQRPGVLSKKRYHFGKPYKFLVDALKKHGKPSKIFVGSSMTYYWEGVHEVIRICKMIYPEVSVTVGGIYPTLCPEHARLSKADQIWTGLFPEADRFAPDLGLLRRKPTYAIIKTTRGCVMKCSYCAVSLLEGKHIWHRPMQDVLTEIEQRIKEGISEFIFWESNILFDARQYLEPLLDEIIKRKYKISIQFPEGFDPRLVYPRLVSKLRKAGLKYVILSFESSSQGLRKRVHKSGDTSAFMKAVTLFQKEGYSSRGKGNATLFDDGIGAFVLAGMYAQPLKTILETIAYVWESGCQPLIMAYTPIPGTEDYRYCERFLSGKALEDLAPSLWPLADTDPSAVDLEEIRERFHGTHFGPDEFLRKSPDSRCMRLLRDAVQARM